MLNYAPSSCRLLFLCLEFAKTVRFCFVPDHSRGRIIFVDCTLMILFCLTEDSNWLKIKVQSRVRLVAQRNMKARLVAVFAACNVILPLMLVPKVEARSTSTFAEPKDSDVIAGPEENTLFDSPGLISSPSDANYKKRTKLSPASSGDTDEIMQTAETYFRPLSRYRELQKEKQEKQKQKQKYESDNEVAAAATVPIATRVTNRVYHTKLLSKNPEYCLPVRNGVVCFYKV